MSAGGDDPVVLPAIDGAIELIKQYETLLNIRSVSEMFLTPKSFKLAERHNNSRSAASRFFLRAVLFSRKEVC